MALSPIEAVLKDVSLRYMIPYRVIEKIYRCEFELLKKSMVTGDKEDNDSFNVIYLRRFGRFVPNYAKLDKVRKNIKERENGKEI